MTRQHPGRARIAFLLVVLVAVAAGGCGGAGNRTGADAATETAAPDGPGGADAPGLQGAADTPAADRPGADAPADRAPDAPALDGSADGPRDDTTSATDGSAAPDGDAPLRCNGYQALCDRRFNDVVFPAAHNAMSNSDDGWIVPDQVHGISRQLADGIRAMLLDTYSFIGDSYLCHTSCLLGSKRLSDGLGEITTFLRQNPNEVLTLIFEDYISAADTEAAFVKSGLDQMVYSHAQGSAWPTLREMIQRNQRVLVGAQTAGPPPAWYHHFYDLAWDTPYAFKSTADFSCALNRGQAGNDLFLLNHWLENPLPSPTLSATANARDVLLGRAQQCRRESGRLPNFVAVSHYSIGDLFDVVRTLNGL